MTSPEQNQFTKGNWKLRFFCFFGIHELEYGCEQIVQLHNMGGFYVGMFKSRKCVACGLQKFKYLPKEAKVFKEVTK